MRPDVHNVTGPVFSVLKRTTGLCIRDSAGFVLHFLPFVSWRPWTSFWFSGVFRCPLDATKPYFCSGCTDKRSLGDDRAPIEAFCGWEQLDRQHIVFVCFCLCFSPNRAALKGTTWRHKESQCEPTTRTNRGRTGAGQPSQRVGGV